MPQPVSGRTLPRLSSSPAHDGDGDSGANDDSESSDSDSSYSSGRSGSRGSARSGRNPVASDVHASNSTSCRRDAGNGRAHPDRRDVGFDQPQNLLGSSVATNSSAVSSATSYTTTTSGSSLPRRSSVASDAAQRHLPFRRSSLDSDAFRLRTMALAPLLQSSKQSAASSRAASSSSSSASLSPSCLTDQLPARAAPLASMSDDATVLAALRAMLFARRDAVAVCRAEETYDPDSDELQTTFRYAGILTLHDIAAAFLRRSAAAVTPSSNGAAVDHTGDDPLLSLPSLLDAPLRVLLDACQGRSTGAAPPTTLSLAERAGAILPPAAGASRARSIPGGLDGGGGNFRRLPGSLTNDSTLLDAVRHVQAGARWLFVRNESDWHPSASSYQPGHPTAAATSSVLNSQPPTSTFAQATAATGGSISTPGTRGAARTGYGLHSFSSAWVTSSTPTPDPHGFLAAGDGGVLLDAIDVLAFVLQCMGRGPGHAVQPGTPQTPTEDIEAEATALLDTTMIEVVVARADAGEFGSYGTRGSLGRPLGRIGDLDNGLVKIGSHRSVADALDVMLTALATVVAVVDDGVADSSATTHRPGALVGELGADVFAAAAIMAEEDVRGRYTPGFSAAGGAPAVLATSPAALGIMPAAWCDAGAVDRRLTALLQWSVRDFQDRLRRWWCTLESDAVARACMPTEAVRVFVAPEAAVTAASSADAPTSSPHGDVADASPGLGLAGVSEATLLVVEEDDGAEPFFETRPGVWPPTEAVSSGTTKGGAPPPLSPPPDSPPGFQLSEDTFGGGLHRTKHHAELAALGAGLEDLLVGDGTTTPPPSLPPPPPPLQHLAASESLGLAGLGVADGGSGVTGAFSGASTLGEVMAELTRIGRWAVWVVEADNGTGTGVSEESLGPVRGAVAAADVVAAVAAAAADGERVEGRMGEPEFRWGRAWLPAGVAR